IILLYQFIRKKKQKYWLYTSIIAIIASLAAIGIMFYYDSLPGYGMMPGLTYFNEFMYSLLASIIFAGMFLLSLLSKIISIIIKRIKRKS
ncbi:MAG: hypothetical protein K2I10_00565, partial [Lachnospiraceae bacterium]|nr:hypothetical protein [Lachnospiraceae bacterium]